MKRFKSCALLCSKNQKMTELVELICSICKNKCYDVIKQQTFKKDDTLVVSVNKEKLPLSDLILFVNEEENKVDIINIIPSKKSDIFSLDCSAYNNILDVFKKDVFLEINDINGCDVEENQEDYTIQEIIPKSYEKLNTWLEAFPLSGHPLDERRWFDFLIALRKNRETLSIDDFSKYIQENYNWSKKDIERFGLKYEEQVELLEYYDENR